MPTTNLHRSTILANGINLFYRDSGADGTPMLCLHGKYGRGETWTDLMARYGERYRVIAPDQRGHGLSDHPRARYAGEDFADDALGLLNALEATQAIVVGHSIGGRNAAYLAAHYPNAVKALVILDAKASGPTDPAMPEIASIPENDWLLGQLPTPYATRQAAHDDIATRFPRPSNIRYWEDSLIETTAGYDFSLSRFAMAAIDACYRDWTHLLPQISCPVLLMRAAQSWYLPAEEAAAMTAALRDGTYVEIADSDHMVYADNPTAFHAAFDAFLHRVG